MFTTLQPPPAPFKPRRTAFERNLLPAFAAWFVEQLERTQPDYLIPAETKGARILDSVLAYTREALGIEIGVPVLYSTALAYMDAEELRRSRILILDDAVRTGQNLARHIDKLRSFGVTDVYAVACIGYADAASDRPSIPCFRHATSELYRDYVWQLTELVVARGLPPEVDHHVFDLHLPERLPLAWATLQETSARHGSLSIDAPMRSEESIVGMTLHFPTLPGTCAHPTTGDACIEGVSKLRFFPDVACGRIEVVPVSFPALDLPATAAQTVGLEDAWQLIRSWTRRDDSVGELLVSEARRRTPETVFRALSTCTEVDLICGLSRALAQVYPAGDVAVSSRRDLFRRLYGPVVGELIAARIDRDVRAALDDGHRRGSEDGATDPSVEPLRLDAEVADTTKQIASDLKQLYDERRQGPAHDPAERVGRSMSEIRAAHPEASSLLVSRCLDFGLAMTTLVPYVGVTTGDDGAVYVRRNYRVSEINRDEEAYEDQNDVDQELSEETVALIAHTLRTRVAGCADSPITERLIAQLAAILRPLVLASSGIGLSFEFEGDDPVVVLRDGPRTATLRNATSAMFALSDGGVVPTRYFVERYDQNRLRLDRRECIEDIESGIELLRQLLEDGSLDELTKDNVLMAWASSTDGQLGLTHVRRALDASLRELARPLRLILRGGEAEASPEAVDRARGFAAAAGARLAHLKLDWAAIPRDRWPRPNKRESKLLSSIAAPATQDLFEIPSMLVALTSSICVLVERLEAAAVHGTGPRPDETARDVLVRCAEIERALTSMSDDEQPPRVPADPQHALAAAAEALLRIGGIVRAFAAATAGAYRGSPRNAASRQRPARASTVMFADISSSFDHTLQHESVVNEAWKNDGLNLIAQWGKALGGWERRDRKGDDIWLEFDRSGDAAVLCAAAVQRHASALRSTGIEQLQWGFRVAVDDGQLQDGDGGNTIGLCLDRASKLAKVDKEDPASIERVLVTPDAVRLTSPMLQEARFGSRYREVQLSDVESSDANFAPREIHAEAVIAHWCARLCTLAEAIMSESDAAPSSDGTALDVRLHDDLSSAGEAAS